MNTCMEYNTERAHLLIPEYGRNVQKMVQHLPTIEDKVERTNAAKEIVRIMKQFNNQMVDGNDLDQRVWSHLYLIADFNLDVDCPYPAPQRIEERAKPGKLEYKNSKMKYKHYGSITQAMIQEAIKYEDGDEKNALIILIANNMKKSYLNFNRDSVNDELIVKHLEELSKGQLTLPEGFLFEETHNLISKPKNNNNNNNGKKNNWKKNNNNNKRRGRRN